MRPIHACVVGVPSPTVWSSVWSKEYAEGILAVCIGIRGGDAASLGRALLGTLEQLFVEKPEEKELLAFVQKHTTGSTELSACLVDHTSLVVYAAGGSGVWVLRGGNGAFIVKPDASTTSLRGAIVPGDTVTIGTREFFATQEGELEREGTPSEQADFFAQRIVGLPASDGVAAWMCQLPLDVQQPTPVPVGEETQKVSQTDAQTTSLLSRLRSRENVRPVRFGQQMRSQLLIKKIALVVFGGILVGVLAIGVNRMVIGRRNAQVASVLDPLRTEIVRIEGDADQSRRLENLQKILEVIQQLTVLRQAHERDHVYLVAIADAIRQAETIQNKLSGEKQIDRLQVYYDFRLVAPDFVGTAIAHDTLGKLAIVLDGDHSRLLSLSLEKKQTQILRVEEQVSSPQALAVDARKAYVLGKTAVAVVSLPLDVPGKVFVSGEGVWQEPGLIQGYGENVYVLDKTARNIYRYDISDPQASPSGWFRSKEGLDFDQLTSFVVDGDVWLADTKGSIFRFSRGMPTDFAITGMLTPPSSTVVLATSAEGQYLYVLEPRAKRLLVIGKDGVYQRSIQSEDLATATGMIIDEEQQKAFVLAGSLVYEVPLL